MTDLSLLWARPWWGLKSTFVAARTVPTPADEQRARDARRPGQSNEGYYGDVDLSAEAIRLARRLHAVTGHEEAAGLLALMLLHHARRPARTRPDGSLVPLPAQDRSLWHTHLVAEGVTILRSALARDRLGEYQAQAAIAALHCDARSTAETDWVQIVEWYDELVAFTDSPVHRLNRAVAVGEADGAWAGLEALEPLDPELPRYTAVAAHLHEKDGDLPRRQPLRRGGSPGHHRSGARSPHPRGSTGPSGPLMSRGPRSKNAGLITADVLRRA